VNGAGVDADGFALLGEASDEVRVDRAGQRDRPAHGTSALATSYDAARRQWTASRARR
jgi:hypothetical protein